MKMRMIVFGVAGLAAFFVCIANVSEIVDSFKEDSSDDISGLTMLLAFVGFVVAGIFGGLFEQARLQLQANNPSTTKRDERKSNNKHIDEVKLLGGIVVTGLAVYEFFTGSISKEYLIPNEDTELLRNIFSSELFPILVGLFGISLLYGAIKPLFGNSSGSK